MKEKISLVILGCAKNLVDSEVLIGGLKSENYDIVSEVNCLVKSSNKIPVFLYLECFTFII